MDELEQAWLDDLLDRAKSDYKVSCALLAFEEFRAAIPDGRDVSQWFKPMLQQMLAVRSVVRVEEIRWSSESPRKPPKDGDAEQNPT